MIKNVAFLADKFRQAVMEGDYDLVRRALDSSKKFGVEDADDMGITLLMYSAQNGKITDRII